jgi:Zn-dependent protease/CBS domain-containing protein
MRNSASQTPIVNPGAHSRWDLGDPNRTRQQSQGSGFRWSWKLLTVAGIDVYVHGTFLLLVGFVGLSEFIAGRGVGAVLRSTLLILAVFATVVMHEFGHALVARVFGIATRDITLLPIGGVARLERMPEKPMEQLLVALAGPAVSLAIALSLLLVARVSGQSFNVEGNAFAGGPFLSQLIWINVSLAVFNLLPGFPMDGGRVLRALLAMRMAPERATQIAARVGQGVAVLFGVVGLFGNPMLIVIAVFVWLGAEAEHSVSAVKVALAGLSVRQGMITDFRTVAPKDPLSRAVDLTLAGFQQDFPVMEGTRLLGVLTQGDLLKGLAGQGRDFPVQQVMSTELMTARPSDDLGGALSRMQQGECRVVMVVDDEKVVGLLTVGNIGERLALDTASHLTGGARGGS